MRKEVRRTYPSRVSGDGKDGAAAAWGVSRKDEPKPTASMRRRSLAGEAPEDLEKQREKERAEKNGLLNNLLEAVERWKVWVYGVRMYII